MKYFKIFPEHEEAHHLMEQYAHVLLTTDASTVSLASICFQVIVHVDRISWKQQLNYEFTAVRSCVSSFFLLLYIHTEAADIWHGN
jgi:hypothetical protein